MRAHRLLSSAIALPLLLVACSDGAQPDGGRRDTGADIALDGTLPSDATADTSIPVDVPRDTADSGEIDRGPCGDGGACANDSRCVAGRCLAWTTGASDPACVRGVNAGSVRPEVQCLWEGPPTGDPTPTARAVLHTPLVANFGIRPDADSPARPSVVFIGDASYREGVARVCEAAGTLRLIDGATCREQASAGAMEDRVNSPVTPAIGDLDGDGRPEIVAAAAAGGLVAFRVDPSGPTLTRLWHSTLPGGAVDLTGSTNCLWNGVTIADIDGAADGRPEIFFEGAVFGADGVRMGTLPSWTRHTHGVAGIVADVDHDSEPELVGGGGVYHWDEATRAMVLESYWTGPGAVGFTAVANLADYATGGDMPGQPEIIVVGNGTVSVVTTHGVVVASLASGSTGGGPPTVADYDGDGRPEIGAAFADRYVVFDVAPAGTLSVLWFKQSQDMSSRVTGSSVFDFNGDGHAEVVYGDECFARVYDGRTGDVLFSQGRFSSTWQENPIVADVDGDFSAEVVMGSSNVCNPGYCPMFDPIFPGLRCDTADDCPSGSCVSGLCRCTMDSECGSSYRCTAPLAGTMGAGNVCRAAHADCAVGVRIYRDARDRWAPSRSIWNQHAYSVTNVNADGTVPAANAMVSNWSMTGLNNFRQNVQGSSGPVPGADLTVGNLEAYCENGNTRLRAQVCNRGGAALDSGVEVIFRQPGRMELCRLRTREPIAAGVCTPVECTAPVPARGEFEAVVDPDARIFECTENNNLANGQADCIG